MAQEGAEPGYKELRHVRGGHASGDEIIEEAALRGLAEMPPEARPVDREQAQAWVEQHAAGPDWDAVEGEYTETQPAQPATNEQAPFEPEPGEDVWADWRKPADAQAWAMTQGKFDHQKHMANAYAKVKEECAPQNAREMWRCWYAYVMAHEPAKAQATDTDYDGDDYDSDEPLFNTDQHHHRCRA